MHSIVIHHLLPLICVFDVVVVSRWCDDKRAVRSSGGSSLLAVVIMSMVW